MSLIREEEVEYLRQAFKESVYQLGVPFIYQYPLGNNLDDFNQPAPDGYSQKITIYGIFDGEPKLKTYKNLGWVVEKSDNLPFLLHIPYDTPHIQKNSLFKIKGQYANIPDRTFQVTELSTALVCPDHIICQVVPLIGNTKSLTKETRRDIALKNSEPRRFMRKD